MALVLDGNGSMTLGNGDLTGMTAAALEATAIGSGALLQTVTATANPSNINTSSTSYVNTGMLDLYITPKAANSKIYVFFNGWHPHINPPNGNYGVAAKIYRNVAGGGAVATRDYHQFAIFSHTSASVPWIDMCGHIHVLDTPTYTVGQQILYQVWYKKMNNNTADAYFHHVSGAGAQSDSGTTVEAIAMEIAG